MRYLTNKKIIRLIYRSINGGKISASRNKDELYY